MPYIIETRRYQIDPRMNDECREPAQNSGELNYQFTCLIQEYIENHGMKYQTLNDVIGALEGAKLEFYRRQVAMYEDKKIIENGDVY